MSGRVRFVVRPSGGSSDPHTQT